MFQSRSFKVASNIESLPFADLGNTCKTMARADVDGVVKEFITKYGLKNKTWVYPQLLAYIGKWAPSRHPSGGYSALDTVKANCAKNEFSMGVYYFCTSNEKAVQKQYDKDGSPYCNLVPLILAAFKKMQNIKYSEWNRDKLDLIVHSRLYAAMTADYYPFSKDDLLQFREIGLTTKSGKSEGTTKSAITTYGLNGTPHEWKVTDPETGEIVTVEGPGTWPALTRMMLCQTWCAHPQNRNNYMILDPKDWDRMPEPLVEENITKPSKPEEFSMSKLPWDA